MFPVCAGRAAAEINVKARNVPRSSDLMDMMKPGNDGMAIVDFTSYHRVEAPTLVKIVQSLRRRDFRLGLAIDG